MNPFLHAGFNICTDLALVLKELVNTMKQHELLELKCPSSRTKSLESRECSSAPGNSSRERPPAGSWVRVPLGGPGRPLKPFWPEREVMDSLETSRKIMQGLLVTELSESFFRLNCEDGERQMGVGWQMVRAQMGQHALHPGDWWEGEALEPTSTLETYAEHGASAEGREDSQQEGRTSSRIFMARERGRGGALLSVSAWSTGQGCGQVLHSLLAGVSTRHVAQGEWEQLTTVLSSNSPASL